MFEIGIITKAQGIRGEFRVLPTTDDPSRFELLIGEEVKIKKNSDENFYKITNARLQKGIVILRLEGVDTRNAAEELVKGVILIPNEKALPLDTDEYYVRDLIGLEVESEEGELLGKITRIFNTGANDVYVIDESFMLPAIKDVIKKVDLSAKKITIHLMEGLRDLKL
ncbi:MAG: ribosome maturation factor RimM [Defluviitaleaceae bacterium]|nr:ribosome maturation factor RimM [Defluviitaleaceae bacterium]